MDKEKHKRLTMRETIDNLEKINQELSKNYTDVLDKYLRISADFDNYRRNKEKEINETKNVAAKDVVISLLEFYDTLKYANDSHPHVTDGTNNIMFNKFKQVLESANVEMYCCEGDKFDDNLHEAVHVAYDGNFGPGEVIRVIKEGCKLNGKIIRYAQVIVNGK